MSKEIYDSLYSDQSIEEEAKWLCLCAPAKADSIEFLLRKNNLNPQSLIEFGSGTGALIQECQHRKLAKEYFAVEWAQNAIEYLRNHSQGIETVCADFTSTVFSIERRFDVVVLSHVLEHLDAPRQFLNDLRRKVSFNFLVVEVPLENLLWGRFRRIIRRDLIDRSGHVWFYNRRSLLGLLTTTGFKMVDERLYVPVLNVETARFVCKKNGLSRLGVFKTLIVARLLTRIMKPLWQRLVYAHYAVLCRR
jgi:SAM-dependent methyltransferase